MNQHAITPTDHREPVSPTTPAHVRETASPRMSADFNAACIRMGSLIARARDQANATPEHGNG